MIIGIGSDLVSIERIRESLDRFGERFARRLLGEREMAEWRAAPDPAAYAAKRFAVKEAAGKALGSGIGEGVSWHDISVGHDHLGAPLLELAGVAARRAETLGVVRSHLSITDEHHYALAFVVLEGR